VDDDENEDDEDDEDGQDGSGDESEAETEEVCSSFLFCFPFLLFSDTENFCSYRSRTRASLIRTRMRMTVRMTVTTRLPVSAPHERPLRSASGWQRNAARSACKKPFNEGARTTCVLRFAACSATSIPARPRSWTRWEKTSTKESNYFLTPPPPKKKYFFFFRQIRQTNVQEGEAGGITQQIGATYIPHETILEKISVLPKTIEVKVPGLLVIDTPGHESFSNLRSRGSSLCNIAILVVDLMHGLEPQTIESINILKQRKTPFIVALNKIDRLFGWQSFPNNGVVDSLEKQKPHVKQEFETRLRDTMTAFAEQGLNAEVAFFIFHFF